MGKIIFGIIGTGWRSDFYLRIAEALPDRFEACSILTRNEEKGRLYEKRWGIKSYTSLDKMLENSNLHFVVVSVPAEICSGMIIELTRRGVPVLAETPPAIDLESLVSLYKTVGKDAKVQVAEQHTFQPLHAARAAIVKSGKLGKITHVNASVAHGYHCMSLIRQLLGIRYENAVISGKRFKYSIIEGPDRNGLPAEERLKTAGHEIAFLDFSGKYAIYDFTEELYFSYIRSRRMAIYGEKGEITDHRVSYLKDFRTPITLTINRVNTGLEGRFEGYCLKGYTAGDDWYYVNPFMPGRLSDDEIAVATCLEKMGEYVSGGPGFYSLAEASQDHYLGLMISKAVSENIDVETTTQVWAEE